MSLKEKVYNHSPNVFQNLLITIFNYLAYKNRYGGKYKEYLKIAKTNRNLSLDELKIIQKKRYEYFLKYVFENSSYYNKLYNGIKDFYKLENINELPIITKEDLRKEIKSINTIDRNNGVISKTGGTTGKSLEVVFTKDNIQERYGTLDSFRNELGYKLGKKTAWFSGKKILNQNDIIKNRFWKTDYLYKVRYYSTFHIKNEYLKYYVEDLIKFQPEYLVGFPSTILEIANYGIKNGLDYPENSIKAIFPTAETITREMRLKIELFFKTKIYNQYASSEGAPWIFECKSGSLHLELQSGVFEVLNENNDPVEKGRLVVTSFTTEGTPLIRYDIGDSIYLDDSNNICQCGNNNPIVKEILGRADDYVYSPETGKINLGNISNTLKDTKGISSFQVVQNSLNTLNIYVVVDKEYYSPKVEAVFLKNWNDRVGDKMEIIIEYVDDISVEKSGKFRMVKNNIKHLI